MRRRESDAKMAISKKILASMMVVGLLALAVGWGTSAYFSDTESSSGNQISAGVLNIQIKDGDQGFWDGTAVTASMSSPAGGLAPGGEFWTDVIYLKNVGTIDAWYVYLHFYGLSVSEGANPESETSGDPNYLMDQIVLTAIWESPNRDGGPSGTTTDFAANNGALADVYLAAWAATKDKSISLYDIVYIAEPALNPHTSFKQHTGDTTNPATLTSYALSVPYIPAGGTAQIQFKFKLLENTDNRAQGDIASFSVDFIATQTPDQVP
jgi:predicted ribosomally synthesized peptide with SipW-like signal peptide